MPLPIGNDALIGDCRTTAIEVAALRTPAPTHGGGAKTSAGFRAAAGEAMPFALVYAPALLPRSEPMP